MSIETGTIIMIAFFAVTMMIIAGVETLLTKIRKLEARLERYETYITKDNENAPD